MATSSELPRYRTLQTEADRGVLTITLNRPRVRNVVGGVLAKDVVQRDRLQVAGTDQVTELAEAVGDGG